MHQLILMALLAGSTSVSHPQSVPQLRDNTTIDTMLAVGGTHNYAFRLPQGGSISATVLQEGVDVVVEIRGNRDTIPVLFDSPNGRNGPDLVEVFTSTPQSYILTIRPFDAGEPAGHYKLIVQEVRDARRTARLLGERRQARAEASTWLRARSSQHVSVEAITVAQQFALDQVAARVRIVGLGEATHGSREFGDARLAITKRLVERYGYRVIALEASATRLSEKQAIEAGWIGRRTQGDLVAWVKQYNARNPNDSVRVVGVDAQDFAPARAELREFIGLAYGTGALARWLPVEAELAAADSQSAVFGDASVKPEVRAAVLELLGVLHLDAPLLLRRYGFQASVAIRMIEILAQFADFNGDGGGVVSHGRDWYMALNVLRALDRQGANAKAVYWAHNAHVAKVGLRTTGGVLQEVVGCDYAAVALTFGAGGFVAQLPNDLEDRLVTANLPAGPAETVESVMAGVGPAIEAAAWACDQRDAPAWLRSPQRMHWVGALFTPGTPPSQAYRPFDLISAFNGILYIPRVTADVIYNDRPLIPARQTTARPSQIDE